jgi:hypothetical protein
MNKQDPIKTLQSDVEIPRVVQNKIDGTLLKIKDEANGSKIVTYKSNEAKTTAKRGKRRFGMVAAIAALVITTVSVGAAVYRNWSKGLEASLHVTEEQKAKLEASKTTTFMEEVATEQGSLDKANADQGNAEQGNANQGNADQKFTEQKITNQGITITATQSITDNYYTYIAFKVEGFEVSDGEQPFFENTLATVEGVANEDMRAIGTFYDGTTVGQDGTVTNADGTPIAEKDGITLYRYKGEDGSMEYHLTVYALGEKGTLLNKKVHVELENLGTVAKTEYTNKVIGKWAFDIDLRGSNETREVAVNAPLGDTGATVIGAEISPISIGATYNFPRKTEKVELPEDEAVQQALAAGVEVEDIETTFEVPIDPPRLMGVKMKDGTLYPYIYMGPGGGGYVDENSDECYTRFAIDRILEVNQVEALLFEKSYAGDGVVPTEANFYVVPIG